MEEEVYGLHSTTSDYANRVLMSPENLIIPAEYQDLMLSSGDHYYDNQQQPHWIPMLGSDELLSAAAAASAVSEAASITAPESGGWRENEADGLSIIKAKIASHPSYPKLLNAYIDCQKVGAPPEIVDILEEILRENVFGKHDGVSSCLGADPELDEFMENYCNILMRYKSDLSRPFDEATNFLSKIGSQLSDLCNDDGAVSSDEELSGGEVEAQGTQMRSSEDRELKDRLLRKFGSHISTLKLEFSKKKKKGKLPKEARQKLLEWWDLHYKWPYPTEADKVSLAESTGLDQKQINNWFINQRKRHWRPSENMHLAVMENLAGHFFADDEELVNSQMY